MMEKILKKYTTIPQSLYVERAADKQLSRIIDEMQRPGYVLVARQMGKTNLLFNAKRTLESDKKKFVYVDLSNYFDSERECYQHIIDSILDSHDEHLDCIEHDIEKIRESTSSAHKEYTKSLRVIIRRLQCDLIIILDEIDALRSAVYSDHIFAQIRSNYFARTNYPELEHLTYVLSGVIEPTDLIKDRNKSPFNIGEKIYLDDFTYEEHCTLINKSKLNISNGISKHIYSWTSGNPRLTFDICSDIESIILEGRNISNELVDELIISKYLKTFDLAPIDHIRELVTNNSDIRDALKIIKGIDSGTISVETKKKLYLYGIISSDFDHDEISIKNKIIDQSMDKDWLLSLSDDYIELYNQGINLIEKERDYYTGIEILNKVSTHYQLSKIEKVLVAYYIGIAKHKIKEYSESNEYLKSEIISVNTSPVMHYRQKLYIGLNYISLADYDNGVIVLEDIINNYKDTSTYLNAVLNTGICLVNSDKDKAYNLFKTIAEFNRNIEIEDDNDSILEECKLISNYYLSTLEKNKNDAISFLEEALKINIKKYHPFLIHQKNILNEEYSDDDLNLIVNTIIENDLGIDPPTNQVIAHNELYHFLYLYVLLRHNHSLFERLYNYTLSLNLYSEIELVLKLYSFIDDKTIATNLLKSYIDSNNENDANLFDIHKEYVYSKIISTKKIDYYYFDLFLNQLIENKELDVTGLFIIVRVLRDKIESSKLQSGINIYESISGLIDELPDKLKYEASVITYWATMISERLKNKNKTKELAEKTIKFLKVKPDEPSMLNAEGEEAIRSYLDKLKYSPTLVEQVINKIKYRRNEVVKVRYDDGNVKKDKYKKLKNDIDNNKCTIIE